ncbi:phosphoribosyltransferase [Actinomadura luteofluorescens]|uniref:Putative phosphoribosyl transferase n=1 Tax=Actinomadura luteofluorescens TaxID=46163 RepID=A0A7Y9ECQ9_9ACTN|nr:phosphoribosyltransferase family protein [Actinomadura luteofluorescens]NYD44990.1 putative phosphoribosyl transferase [Actinomadura luteofluorescens]
MYSDRQDAGRQLVANLRRYTGGGVRVLGLHGGGVPVAAETAARLGCALDALVVRELVVPGPPGVLVGAVAEGPARVLDEEAVRRSGAGETRIRELERDARVEARALGLRLRGRRPSLPPTGRDVIVVDDGAAGRLAAEVACRDARAQGAGRVVFAVAAAPPATIDHLWTVADEVVCPLSPTFFVTASDFYLDFAPVSEVEAARLLERASQHTA